MRLTLTKKKNLQGHYLQSCCSGGPASDCIYVQSASSRRSTQFVHGTLLTWRLGSLRCHDFRPSRSADSGCPPAANKKRKKAKGKKSAIKCFEFIKTEGDILTFLSQHGSLKRRQHARPHEEEVTKSWFLVPLTFEIVSAHHQSSIHRKIFHILQKNRHSTIRFMIIFKYL